MDNKPIISKKLILTDRVNIGALEPILNNINLRIQQIDQMNSTEPLNSQYSNFSNVLECLDGNVLTEPAKKLSTHAIDSSTKENSNALIMTNSVENERALHQRFIDNVAGSGNKYKYFSLEVELSISLIEKKIFLELVRKGKTYFFEIRNGYPIYLDTFDGFFELFVSGKLFTFNHSDQLQSFETHFELHYPWPVYLPKSGQVNYRNKKVVIQKTQVEIT